MDDLIDEINSDILKQLGNDIVVGVARLKPIPTGFEVEQGKDTQIVSFPRQPCTLYVLQRLNGYIEFYYVDEDMVTVPLGGSMVAIPPKFGTKKRADPDDTVYAADFLGEVE